MSRKRTALREKRKILKRTQFLKKAGIAGICIMLATGSICLFSNKKEEPHINNISSANIASKAAQEIISTPLPAPLTQENGEETKETENTDETEELTETTEAMSAVHTYYNIPLSHDLQDYMFQVCTEYSLDPSLVVAVMEHESGFDPNARSDSKDSGLMQVNDINLIELDEELGITNIYDPYQNILGGAYILSKCFQEVQEENPALMCYNMGISTAKEFWDKGVYSSEYSRDIYARYLQIKREFENTE